MDAGASATGYRSTTQQDASRPHCPRAVALSLQPQALPARLAGTPLTTWCGVLPSTIRLTSPCK